ncbi:MAG: Spo0E family sporulation regulatory protein-aspartic acid phosphatase [Dethiobacteria bacterium]
MRVVDPVNSKHRLFQQIEILRDKLHQEKNLTNHDVLKLSAELDLLILEAMKNRNNNIS